MTHCTHRIVPEPIAKRWDCTKLMEEVSLCPISMAANQKLVLTALKAIAIAITITVTISISIAR